MLSVIFSVIRSPVISRIPRTLLRSRHMLFVIKPKSNKTPKFFPLFGCFVVNYVLHTAAQTMSTRMKSGCREGHKSGDYIHALLGQELHLPTAKNCRLANGTFSRYCCNIFINHISLIKRLPSYLKGKFPI
jgi:hypothetical protein